MQLAITGATGFLGRYIVRRLAAAGHVCCCWRGDESDCSEMGVPAEQLRWVTGRLGDLAASRSLVAACEAVVHAALYHPGGHFREGDADLLTFVETNVLGTIKLIEAARAEGVARFIFISTCAVHDEILSDRPLDEAHPLWPRSHYGAHKAAIEKFVHSYGLGSGYDICSLRPTGIYGIAHPVEHSKWYDLVRSVVKGGPTRCERGGKEVHAADVARAVEILLQAPNIAGQAYNCYDMYVSEFDVAQIAQRLSGSEARIDGEPPQPKHQIQTSKLRSLGMEFGGQALLERTVKELLDAVA